MQPLTLKAIVLLLCTYVISAQSQHQFSVFTKKDGLTSVSVTATLVDSKGIVWIGTDNGLNAYANSQWYAIKSIEDNKTGKQIALGKIHVIYEDRKRNIWVSTQDDLFLYNGEYWTDFQQNTDEESYVVKDFFEDRQGRIWCAQEHHQDLNDIKEFRFNLISGKLQMYDHIRWYKFDDDLAGTASLEFKMEPKFFTSIFQDQSGTLWFGTLKGIYNFDMKEWTEYRKDELKTEKVFKLINDKKGEKWAATESGISRLASDTWINYSKRDGLTGTFIYDLCEDPAGRKWAFSRSELKFTGLSMFDGEKWHAFDDDALKIKGFVETLIWDETDVIAYSNDGISRYIDGNWQRFDKKHGLKNEAFSQIQKDKYGDVWLAGESGFYHYSEKRWEEIYNPEEDWKVTIIYADKSKQLWLGTEKSGLYHFNGETWIQYSEDDGLADDHVVKIFEDKLNRTWVISKKGISMFHPKPDQ